MSQTEIWKPCYGFEGFYEASSLGRIRSLSRTVKSGFGSTRTFKGRIIKGGTQLDGYKTSGLRIGTGKKIHKKTARLIALTFIPNPEKKPQVNHKNGIRTDDRVENLEWVTASENIIHSMKVLGRKMYVIPAKQRGAHPSARPVNKLSLDGKFIKRYDCIADARDENPSTTQITSVVRGERKTAGGFKWEYA